MTLFLYVLRSFFRYVSGTILLSVFLFVLFDFIHKSTKYLGRYNPETKHLLLLYLYQIPSLIIQAFPISSLLASVICMVLLSRSNEITAMRAAGMGPLRIGLPIIFGSSILCLFSFLIGEFILPDSAKKMHFVENVLIKKDDNNEVEEGTRWIRGNDMLYHFKEYDPISKKMFDVKIIQIGSDFIPKSLIQADIAIYRNAISDWFMPRIKIFNFWPNGTLSHTQEKQNYRIKIPVSPEKLRKERRLPNELSTNELRDIIGRGEVSGIDILSYKVDMHVKFAFHFASLIVSLIGLKFGYKSERSMETAKGVLLALAIGISYYFILHAGITFGKSGTLPPLVAAWLSNFIIFGISWFSIIRVRKN